MLYKFSFLPDYEKTQEALASRNPSASQGELSDEVERMFSNVHGPTFDVFVQCEDLTEALRKIVGWFDHESCVLTHNSYDGIVFSMISECVGVNVLNLETVLNATAILE